MDLEKKQEENKVVARTAFFFIILSFILFVTAVVHSGTKLHCALNTEELKKSAPLRIGFLIIAIILGGVYWIIYPVAYMMGAFNSS